MRLVALFGVCVAGAALVLVSLWGSLWVMLAAAMAAQRPDPRVSDGDPCCGHPDTWGQVAEWGGTAVALGALDGAIAALGVGLLCAVARGRFPAWRRLALVPLAAALLTAGAMAIGLLLADEKQPDSAVARRATP